MEETQIKEIEILIWILIHQAKTVENMTFMSHLESHMLTWYLTTLNNYCQFLKTAQWYCYTRRKKSLPLAKILLLK
jgi:hypothetical protein